MTPSLCPAPCSPEVTLLASEETTFLCSPASATCAGSALCQPPPVGLAAAIEMLRGAPGATVPAGPAS